MIRLLLSIIFCLGSMAGLAYLINQDLQRRADTMRQLEEFRQLNLDLKMRNEVRAHYIKEFCHD